MGGRPKRVSDEEILYQMFIAEDPIYTAKEVGDFVNLSRQGAYKRLKEFEERSLVSTKQPGRDRVWWLSDKGVRVARRYAQEQDSQ